jgi:hypothetical protein
VCRTLRLPVGVHPPRADRPALVRRLLGWAAAAGLGADPADIGAALGGQLAETAVYDVADAFGMDQAPEVGQLFDHDEDEWWDVWHQAQHASAWVCRDWTRGDRPLPGYDQPPPGTAELVHFVDTVAESMYGGGLSRQEIAAGARRLEAAFPRRSLQ